MSCPKSLPSCSNTEKIEKKENPFSTSDIKVTLPRTLSFNCPHVKPKVEETQPQTCKKEPNCSTVEQNVSAAGEGLEAGKNPCNQKDKANNNQSKPEEPIVKKNTGSTCESKQGGSVSSLQSQCKDEARVKMEKCRKSCKEPTVEEAKPPLPVQNLKNRMPCEERGRGIVGISNMLEPNMDSDATWEADPGCGGSDKAWNMIDTNATWGGICCNEIPVEPMRQCVKEKSETETCGGSGELVWACSPRSDPCTKDKATSRGWGSLDPDAIWSGKCAEQERNDNNRGGPTGWGVLETELEWIDYIGASEADIACGMWGSTAGTWGALDTDWEGYPLLSQTKNDKLDAQNKSCKEAGAGSKDFLEGSPNQTNVEVCDDVSVDNRCEKDEYSSAGPYACSECIVNPLYY